MHLEEINIRYLDMFKNKLRYKTGTEDNFLDPKFSTWKKNSLLDSTLLCLCVL